MNLNPQELAKVRKSSLYSVTISNEMKSSVVDTKLRELNAEIKKKISKNDERFELILLRL